MESMDRTALITFEQVSYHIDHAGTPRIALRNIDLSVYRGEWLAVAGTNGSGKSTLAKIAAGLYSPTGGNLKRSIGREPAVQLIFQNPETALIGETPYEDVCLGLANFGVSNEDIPSRALDALRQVGLAQLAHAPAASLSGGQKQLLAIAGCLAAEPAVYIFDEATSMLDPQAREGIIHIARRLHREGATILWITQLLDELVWADRVAALEEGRLRFTGTSRAFFYEIGDDGMSCCEQLGFAPPYTIQAVRQLVKHGYRPEPLPLTPEQLGKAVSAL
ncbi:Energy-coupling factor transporter ATP-binding protein EcfA2 [Paenibacillus konkukensis]|uniref:Energy-coupling factor transporter ATP-binding protein EcfA2 n=2 Tax=Paenibacillus konkukensis TaxID=2020716 RepID=A0ABY4RL57_9BACL|nr:Energy-coupling factor transporter ATP-binding protein EcfA2 [Paenibacillus konkukensis]